MAGFLEETIGFYLIFESIAVAELLIRAIIISPRNAFRTDSDKYFMCWRNNQMTFVEVQSLHDYL